MFFTSRSDQRVGTRLIFYRKVRPCSQLHRPDREASQIAEVHLADRILQNEGKVRDGKHVVGADSTLHYPAFLPLGRIFAESPRYFRPRLHKIELLSLRAYKPRLSLTAISMSCSDPR